jgi:hypothetical protein
MIAGQSALCIVAMIFIKHPHQGLEPTNSYDSSQSQRPATGWHIRMMQPGIQSSTRENETVSRVD